MIAAEKAANAGKPRHSFAQLFELAFVLLASPWKIYEKGTLEVRRTVVKLAFADRIPYCPKTDTLNTRVLADQVESWDSQSVDFLIHASCREEVDMDGQAVLERFAEPLRCLA